MKGGRLAFREQQPFGEGCALCGDSDRDLLLGRRRFSYARTALDRGASAGVRRLDVRRVKGEAIDQTAGPTGCSVRRRALNDVREVDPAVWRPVVLRPRWTACVPSVFSDDDDAAPRSA